MSELSPSVYDERKTRRVAGALAGLMLAVPAAGYRAETASAESTGNNALIHRIDSQVSKLTAKVLRMQANRAPNLIPNVKDGGLIHELVVWYKEPDTKAKKPKYDQVVLFFSAGDKKPFIVQQVVGSPQKNFSTKVTPEFASAYYHIPGSNNYELTNIVGDFKLSPKSEATKAQLFSNQFDEFISEAGDMVGVAGSGLPSA